MLIDDEDALNESIEKAFNEVWEKVVEFILHEQDGENDE